MVKNFLSFLAGMIVGAVGIVDIACIVIKNDNKKHNKKHNKKYNKNE